MKQKSMKHWKPRAKKWSLALAILLGSGMLATAVTPNENREVYGSWVMMDLENAGMYIYSTLTIRPDRIDVLTRCSIGDKQVEANATTQAQITENKITITEAKHVEKEYSPGFLNCRASISAMSVNYRLDDGKLILFAPGTDESHELHRESPE